MSSAARTVAIGCGLLLAVLAALVAPLPFGAGVPERAHAAVAGRRAPVGPMIHADCSAGPLPSVTPAATATPCTPTPTPTDTATASPAATATPPATPAPSPTSTVAPTPTDTATPTATATSIVVPGGPGGANGGNGRNGGNGAGGGGTAANPVEVLLLITSILLLLLIAVGIIAYVLLRGRQVPGPAAGDAGPMGYPGPGGGTYPYPADLDAQAYTDPDAPTVPDTGWRPRPMTGHYRDPGPSDPTPGNPADPWHTGAPDADPRG